MHAGREGKKLSVNNHHATARYPCIEYQGQALATPSASPQVHMFWTTMRSFTHKLSDLSIASSNRTTSGRPKKFWMLP